MSLPALTGQIIRQLIDLLEKISPEEYSRPLELLEDNTLGKHIRHIVEFYQCLADGYSSARVNYDERKRDLQLETHRDFAIETLSGLLSVMQETPDGPLELKHETDDGACLSIRSSFYRELLYNNEHAVHHMAIIRLAFRTCFPERSIDTGFGVAASTLRYREKCAS